MKNFLHLKSYSTLASQAKQPIDLTKEGVLTPERIRTMQASALGFDLFYATERVTNEGIEALWNLADESGALEQMAAMQEGAVLNLSENRAALHTAMRDQFDHPQKSKNGREAREAADRELDKLEDFLDGICESRFTDMIQIGIGGSDLGPRALYLALKAYKSKERHVHFISNVDPDDANAVLDSVDLSKTLIVVVSKSGTTLETMTNEELVRDRLAKNGLDPKKHIIAVTGEKSPMDDPGRYLATFYMWDYVGGRFSTTSMVGGVVLGFALGFGQWMEILRGAHAMDLHALEKRNLPLLNALLGIWNRNFLHLPTLAIIPYSAALVRFPAHLQQLEMESNGKRIDRSGNLIDYSTAPVIWGEPGTNGQHSFFQMIHQGTNVIPVEMIGFRNSQYPDDFEIQFTFSQEKLLSNLFAQSIALAVGQKNANLNKMFPGNRPNRILMAERLDPFTMGALLAFYEHRVAFQGFIWNVNSFDQEGVQLGKVLASRMLDLYAATRTSRKASFPLGEAFLQSR